MRFNTPNVPIADKDGNLTQPWLFAFERWNNMINDMTDEGTTAQRPTNRLYVGRPYIDRTLNKQIWFSAMPNVWRDAAGVVV